MYVMTLGSQPGDQGNHDALGCIWGRVWDVKNWEICKKYIPGAYI